MASEGSFKAVTEQKLLGLRYVLIAGREKERQCHMAAVGYVDTRPEEFRFGSDGPLEQSKLRFEGFTSWWAV